MPASIPKKMKPSNFWSSWRPAYLRRIIRDSIRVYFAPIVGAVRGVRTEYRAIERDRRKDKGRRL